MGTEDAERAPLTVAEVSRIAKATGKKPREFVRAASNEGSAAFFKSLTGMGPLIGKPIKYILKTTQDRKCVFLGETGCTLEKSVRPHWCRLFPFWFHGSVEKGFRFSSPMPAPDCLAKAITKDPATLAKLLDTSAKELVEIATQFITDTKDEDQSQKRR